MPLVAHIEKRPTKNGAVRYRALVRLKGAAPMSATFERKTDAKKWVQQTESAIREGRHFKSSEANRHTGAELIERYVQEILPRKPKSIDPQLGQLRWWQDHIGQLRLGDITPLVIAESRSKLGSEPIRNGGVRSASTVNRYMAALSHVFTVAVREWGWLEDNPIRRIAKLKEPKGRVRFLSDDERARLLAACRASRSPLLYPAVVVALSTGMRKNEILGLRWNHVDLERRVAVLVETKNDEHRAVPLAGHALKVIGQLFDARDPDCPYVFPGKSGASPVDLRTPWETALKRAGIEDFRFHDLRHSAASYLAMNGASLAEIADVLGHKTLQMVKRYTHLSEQHTAGVVERMNEKIFGNEKT